MLLTIHVAGLDPEGDAIARVVDGGFDDAVITQDRHGDIGTIELDVDEAELSTLDNLSARLLDLGIQVIGFDLRPLTPDDDRDRDLAARFESGDIAPVGVMYADDIDDLRAAARSRSEDDIRAAVDRARIKGHSWSLVGAALGTSGDATRQRYGTT